MKKRVIVLIVVAAAIGAWLLLRPGPPERPTPVADPATLRSTTHGDVMGFIDDHGAQAWMGIPFAAPPVGERRWRAPQPPAAWDGVREALAAGGRCPQKPSPLAAGDGAEAAIAGQEDCLYLNVWAPPNARGLPVMLWIHGGGNTIGSGDTYIGAALAARQQVVVITINYRLGPMGWFAHPALATGDPQDDSGNYGTLDIVRALEWTRDNAAAFGGDPDNVTVFGESAGAFNTLAMMASPLAEGLFHRAIVQSGGFRPTPPQVAASAIEDGGHPYSAVEIVNRLLVADGAVADRAAALALQSDMGAADLRGYLYDKTPADIYALWEGGGFGMINAPDTFGDGHVLPALGTAEIFGDADNHRVVPVMLGSNRDEPALFMAQNPEFVRYRFGFLPRLKDEADYLRRVKYGGLAWKARGVDELAELMAAAGNDAVYAYRFDWDELGSRLGYDLSKALGAAHFLEVPFVFGDFDNFPLAYLFRPSEARNALSETMMSYWANFAYTGDPGRGRDGTLPRWAAWNEDGHTSIVLDTDAGGGIRMITDKVSRHAVLGTLASDPEIPDEETRCALYRDTFGWDPAFHVDDNPLAHCDPAS